MPSFRQVLRQVFDADRDNLKVTNNVTGVGSGRLEVASKSTAEQLSSGTPSTGTPVAFKFVDVQALFSNTDVVAVGGSPVSATPTGHQVGVILLPGYSVRFEGDDLQDVYVAVAVDGEGVVFNYYT